MAKDRSLIGLRTRALVALTGLVLASAAFVIFELPRLLVLNNPMPSDYIAVLDGHDDNYYEGLRLLQSGVAKRMFVCLDLPDVPLRREELKKDMEFVRRTAGKFADAIDVCENDDEDAFTELGSVLETSPTQRVLIVTPASESRAAYIIAKRRFPRFAWSVLPSLEPNFNVKWWHKRDWADTYVRSLGHLAAALREPQVPEASVERSSR